MAVNYSRDEDGARRVVKSIVSAGGVAEAFRFDVRDEDAVTSGVGSIGETLGPVAVIVSNAIGMHSPHPVEEQGWSHYLYLQEFCLKAPLLLLKSVVGDWKRRRSGCFFNIGSESVDLAKANSGPYLAAKAAMTGTTRSWAQELGPFDIRVNLVAPGFIPVERHSEPDESAFDAYARHVPLGRLGAPQDIGNSMAFPGIVARVVHHGPDSSCQRGKDNDLTHPQKATGGRASTCPISILD